MYLPKEFSVNTTHLATLIAVADAGSLSRVAQQRKTSVSSISRQIAEIEQTLRTPLLLRTGRGVRLTPAGEGFIERARFLLRDLDLAIAEATALDHPNHHPLHLSSPIEVALSLLPSSLSIFHQAHPTVRLDIHAEARKVSLLEESYDAALRLGPLQDMNLLARPVGEVALFLCGPPSLRLQKPSFEAICSLPFAGAVGTNEKVQAVLRQKTFDLSIHSTIRMSTFSEAAEFAALSERAVILPSYTASRFLRDQRLMLLAPTLKLPTISLHMLLSQHHRKTPPLQTLYEILREQLAKHNTLPSKVPRSNRSA